MDSATADLPAPLEAERTIRGSSRIAWLCALKPEILSFMGSPGQTNFQNILAVFLDRAELEGAVGGGPGLGADAGGVIGANLALGRGDGRQRVPPRLPEVEGPAQMTEHRVGVEGEGLQRHGPFAKREGIV